MAPLRFRSGTVASLAAVVLSIIGPATVRAAIAPCIPNADTVLLLHLDGDVSDASPAGRSCSLTPNVYIPEGVTGQALHLDGQTGTISSQNFPDLSSGFTVEAWLRLPRPEKDRFGKVLELPGCFSWTMNTYRRGRAKIEFSVDTAKGRGTMKTVEYVPCAIWVHVACVYSPAASGKDRLALYINGTHADRLTKYQTQTPPDGTLKQPAGDLILGGLSFVGDIDELRLTSRALGPEQLNGSWLSGVSGVFDVNDMQWIPRHLKTGRQDTDQPKVVSSVAVPTFTAIGIRLRADGDLSSKSSARLRYRPAGDTWRDGMALHPAPHDPELRGSILHLAPDTEYEIEITPTWGNGTEHEPILLTARTWPETVPIARSVILPPGVIEAPLTIVTSGTEIGWVRYAPPEGQDATIDAGSAAESAVTIKGAAYVIFERVHVRGGARHGVSVIDSHHVRIRSCDISGWGRLGIRGEDGIRRTEKGEKINYDAGVYVGPGSSQVVVEHNLMHQQRGSANSWEFGHPVGPQGLIIANSKGNHVIRYNDMIGSETNWWNDAIESVSNGAVTGGPYRDTDIYGNTFMFANDDGTELDGGQINVRYHHNWVEKALCGLSCAPCLSGPCYVYRNVFSHLGDERGRNGSAFKMGGGAKFSPGLNVVFHNTVYGTAGGLCSVGFGTTVPGSNRGGYHAFARNNLFAGPSDRARDVTDKSSAPASSFDYDLLGRGGADVAPGNETHAVREKPTFVDAASGDIRPTAESAGVDAGIHIPGMNDGYAGSAPDMGAFEADADQAFPPRPHGMTVVPRRVVATRLIGGSRGRSADVSLIAPVTAGASWQAIPNSPWLRCEPAWGACNGAPVSVRINWDLEEMTAMGTRRGAVTFRTNLGFLRTIPIDVQVYREPVEVLLEAEKGELTGEMTAVADSAVSGNAYIHVPIPAVPLAGPARIAPRGEAAFTVEISSQGEYFIAGHAFAPEPSGLHDSFFVSVDGEKPVLWAVSAGSRWAWTLMDHTWILSPGTHRFAVQSRETGTRLDRILVTNNRVAGPLEQVLRAP